MTIKQLRIATRQSRLALWQANFVKQQLLQLYPDLHIELIGITTQGDQIQDKTLAQLGGKGLFVKALEDALLTERADLAVHSMKDVPPVLPESLTIAAILERNDPRDVLVSNRYSSLAALPADATVATCSVRRQAQLLAYQPQLQLASLRGNVNTRLAKLDNEQFDAIILAAAGLARLQLTERISEYLSIELMLPSVGQGALGIEVLQHKTELIALLAPLIDKYTMLCVNAERALVKALSGHCHSPIGAYATIKNNTIMLRGLVASLDGQQVLKAKAAAAIELADNVATNCTTQLLNQGAAEILAIGVN